MIDELLYFVILGMVTGTLSGLLGIGGGIVIVPGLIIYLEHIHFNTNIMMQVTAATSLTSICATSLVASLYHHKILNVRWDVVKLMTPGIMIGCAFGAYGSQFIASNLLKIFLGCALLAISIRMFAGFLPKPERTLPNKSITHAISLFIGCQAGLLGIGGSSFMIPFFTHCNIPMRKASGTSVALSFPIAISGAITYGLTHRITHLTDVQLIGAIYWPAAVCIGLMSVIFTPLGGHLATYFSNQWLKRFFAVFLFIAGLRMIIPSLLPS